MYTYKSLAPSIYEVYIHVCICIHMYICMYTCMYNIMYTYKSLAPSSCGYDCCHWSIM